MAARTTWRWMFWSTSIFQAIMIVVSFTAFHETYAPRLLEKEAKRRRLQTGDQRYQTLQERAYAGKSTLSPSIFFRSLSRPLRLLIFHPIIQIASVISGFNYGLLYIVLTSFSSLWTQEYGQPVEISGLHYIACALGEVAGSQLGGPLMDTLYRYMRARSSTNEHVPEHRFPLTVIGASLVPLGLIIYGWTAHFHVPWIAVDIGMFIAMFGMQIGGLPMQAYVIDTYGEHTSSALAAMQFLRSLTAFLFPLFTPAMYRALGYGWGNTLLAFASVFLGFSAPLILWTYGARLREKAISSY